MISQKALELMQASREVCQDLMAPNADELTIRKNFETKIALITKEFLENGKAPLTVVNTDPLVETSSPVVVPVATTHPSFFGKTFKDLYSKEALAVMDASLKEVIEVLRLVLDSNNAVTALIMEDNGDSVRCDMLDLREPRNRTLFMHKYLPMYRWASVESGSVVDTGEEYFYFCFGGHKSGFNSYVIGCLPESKESLLACSYIWNQYVF